MSRARYDAYVLGRWFIVSILTVLFISGSFALTAVVSEITVETDESGPPLVFVILWLLGLAVKVYMCMFRLSWRLELVDSTVLWQTIFSSRAASASDVLAIGPSTLTEQLSIVTLRDGTKILTKPRPGFSMIAEEVLRLAPEASYTANAYEQRLTRHTRQWQSGFRKVS